MEVVKPNPEAEMAQLDVLAATSSTELAQMATRTALEFFAGTAPTTEEIAGEQAVYSFDISLATKTKRLTAMSRLLDGDTDE